jgi:hypothetical protein
MVPKTGAFEISFNGVLFFSKLLSGMWPNFDLIGSKSRLIYEDYINKRDI